MLMVNSFNSQYALIQNIFLKEKNYEMLNELLDKSIEELSGVNAQFIIQEQQFENMMKPALETFQNSVDKIKERFSSYISVVDEEKFHEGEERIKSRYTFVNDQEQDINEVEELVVIAVNGLLNYLNQTQKMELKHINKRRR